MKKIFTLISASMMAMAAMATDYTCPLVVNINGESTAPSNVQVSIDQQGDGYTLKLQNFILVAGEDAMPVGNIVVNNVTGIKCGTTTALSTQQTIQIENGDDSQGFWMGPLLGDVPITLLAEATDTKLNAVLNINMGAALGIIKVNLGDKAAQLGQLPNSGFSEYHTAEYNGNTSDEPNGWHSFMSCTGKWYTFVSGKTHTFISETCAPSSTDGKSVEIKSTAVLGQSANGTITTGRLCAGSMTATSTDNNSFADLGNTDLDKNGDPFYAVLTTKPDSMKVWLKYKVGNRGSKNADNVYATVSAIINDGTNVQDPEVDAYSSSIIARAKNAEIASNDEAWQEVSIPFTYADNASQPKSILVTMSTCSVASGGSTKDDDPDILTVDSVALVYNAGIASLTYKGAVVELNESGVAEVEANGEVSADDFVVTADGVGAIVTKSYEKASDASDGIVGKLTVNVVSNDLKQSNAFVVNVKDAGATGIASIKANGESKSVKAYALDGKQVKKTTKGLYIIGGRKVVK